MDHLTGMSGKTRTSLRPNEPKGDVMKKLFLVIALLCSASFAQTFDNETLAAHTAVQQLQQAAEAKVAFDAQQVAALTTTNTQQAATIQQLQSKATYRDLEWGAWSLNDSVKVGGSANGTTFFTVADTNQLAVFSATPTVTGSTNYYDVYATQKKKPNAAYHTFYLAATWNFPTDADMKAAHCIEMEVRQVFNSGLAAIPALQMNFTGNQLRYFDKSRSGWFATGIAMPRSRSIVAILEAHRDETTLYYDAMTINGTRYALTINVPLVNIGWADRMSVSVQLDAKTVPFKVNPSAMVLAVAP